MVRAELRVLLGRQQGTLIPLPAGKFLIGREEDCHLRPNSELVSRHHCVFTTDDFTVRVRDLGSTNGTLVNGERIRGAVVLRSGDRVAVGKIEVEVLIHDAAESPQSAPVSPGEFNQRELAGVSDDTQTVAATETLSEFPVPEAPQEMPLNTGDTHYYPPPGVPPVPAGYAPMGYPPQYMQQPYGYPAYPPPFPGYYPAPVAYPPGPGGYAQPPAPAAAAPSNGAPEVPDVRLPDPATTGVKPTAPVEAPKDAKPADGKGKPPESVPDSAAKIIKQYLQRRPTS
jgi:predicted component of type VI protein secretion system